MAGSDFTKDVDWMSLADTCKRLGRARSTLMRLLPRWEAVTGHKPRKDHSGRWFIPVQSVQNLIDNPELYLELAGRATEWSSHIDKLKRENKQLREKIKTLEMRLGE